jgi:hypothetical protein
MNKCEAHYRLPEGFFENLESDLTANNVTPEEVAISNDGNSRYGSRLR